MTSRPLVLFCLGLAALLALNGCRSSPRSQDPAHRRGTPSVPAARVSLDVLIQEGNPADMEARQHQ